jgi:hypothetical protein
MSTTVPITLTPVPVPVGVEAANINQLLTIISQFMAGSISQDVSFFQSVASDPTVGTTPIIFNTTQGVFKYWDVNLGKYVALTQFQPGDIKNTFVSGDSPQTGWVVCDGRLISAVPNISQTQQGILNSLFGVGSSLPVLTPVQGFSGLPPASSFSNVNVPVTAPPANQIANLPFSSDYNPVEPQNLAGNTETLRTSQNGLRTAVTEMQALSEAMLSAISNPTASVTACVFVGYP